MELKDLRKKIASKSISSCFMVERGNIYEFKIAFIEGKKDVIPIEVINQILRRSSNLIVHNTEVKVCLMDAILIRDGAKVDKNYKYQNGDKVYKIINVKNSKHLFIREYEVVQIEGVHELIEINKYNIYYLNDVFRYNFPEAVEEEIRKEYLENINY